jgi:hypothetical protein
MCCWGVDRVFLAISDSSHERRRALKLSRRFAPRRFLDTNVVLSWLNTVNARCAGAQVNR